MRDCIKVIGDPVFSHVSKQTRLETIKRQTWSKSRPIPVINILCCVGTVEIQIEVQKGWCTANTHGVRSWFFERCFALTKGRRPKR